MRVLPSMTLVAASVTLLTIPSAARAQAGGGRVTIEARGGLNVPTFGISDAVDAGPSFGIGAAVQVRPRVYLLGDVDLGFHPGAGLPGGASAPDVKVYHYMAKVGYQVLAEGTVDDVRGELTLGQRFIELAGGLSDVEGLEWLHTFSG